MKGWDGREASSGTAHRGDQRRVELRLACRRYSRTPRLQSGMFIVVSWEDATSRERAQKTTIPSQAVDVLGWAGTRQYATGRGGTGTGRGNLYSSSAQYSTSPHSPPVMLDPNLTHSFVTVLRLDKVDKRLGLLVTVVVVVMAVVRGANILHLVDAAALGAPLDGALLGHLQGSA